MPESETVQFPLPPSPVAYEPGPEMRGVMEKCPVSKVTMPDDSTAWLVTGFSVAREVFVDQRFSRELVYEPGRNLSGVDVIAGNGILALDPPAHSRLRKLVAGAFTGKRVAALRPRVAEIVDELIDAMLAGPRPADLEHAFALALPSSVICALLGVPVEDTDQFREWSNALSGDASQAPEKAIEAWRSLAGYMAELVARKREEPADDLISALIAARDSVGRLSEEELVNFCVILLVAGYETTANMTSLSFIVLCQNPGQLEALRADPELIPGAVEELLRYVILFGVSPFTRVTREEVCLGGVTIPAGETVLPSAGFANRDPSEFDDPDRLDVRREPQSHLAFGAGAHHCLGAQLARLELQEAFRGLLARLPGLRMAVPLSELSFREGEVINGVRALPVTWDDPR